MTTIMSLDTKIFLTTYIGIIFMALIIIPAKMGWHKFSLLWALVGGAANFIWLSLMWGEDLEYIRQGEF